VRGDRCDGPRADLGGFYDGRRVLVTGHTGFKGGWLCRWLHRMGASVRGLALDPPTTPNLFHALDVERCCESTIGDVRDAAIVERVVQEHQPELVLHLAAQPLVRRSWHEPRLTVETNVVGALNVLDAAVRCPSTRSVVVVTSDKCYENRGWAWPYRESDALGGHDPYSASKAAVEMVARAYRRPALLGVDHAPARVVTARAGNVIGGGDWAGDRLLPDAARAFSTGRDLVIRNPASIRPWQHVLEALSGYLWLGACATEQPDEVGDAYNFGPTESGGAVSAEAIGHLALRAWGDDTSARVVRTDRKGPGGEDAVLRLDVALAGKELGWWPVWDVERAVHETMRWYRAFTDAGEDVDHVIDLTDRQVATYIHDAAHAGVRWATPAEVTST
jgi:CDP-glucose 4,6-dehydratase